MEGYKLLLDYPDNENPNYLRIYDSNDNEIWKSHYKEEGVDDPNFVNAFNAYSKNGIVKGDPVYVNYGTIEDFEWLQANHTDIMKDKICLARYGQIFRGNKAENAANFGCTGLAIFMDPSGVAQVLTILDYDDDKTRSPRKVQIQRIFYQISSGCQEQQFREDLLHCLMGIQRLQTGQVWIMFIGWTLRTEQNIFLQFLSSQ